MLWDRGTHPRKAPSPSGVNGSLTRSVNEYLQMYFKDFDTWNIVKKKIHNEEKHTKIRAGEVRWISFGVNVGKEIDGKGASFTRPALIVHVIGPELAFVVPMSTKMKNVPGYFPFEFQGKMNSLCINQARVISQQRVLGREGRISEKRLTEEKAAIKTFFRF